MSRPLFVGSLLAGWVLLWGKLSVANVLSGVVLITVLFMVLPEGRPDTGPIPLRPRALGRLLAFFVKDLVTSNLVLVRMVLRRRVDVRSGVITVQVAECSPAMLAFVANLIALTPGTMAVGTESDPCRIEVHLLDISTAETSRTHIQHLAERAIAAFALHPTVPAPPTPPTSPAPATRPGSPT